MASHKALGRGLDALFASTKEEDREQTSSPANPIPMMEPKNQIRDIPVDKIKPNRHQPRSAFDETSLRELADSIKRHGVTQSLVVTETAVGEYELVVGERRLRASKMAGLKSVPCRLIKLSNRERFEWALIENLQREDLNAMEEAIGLDGLMKGYDLTQDEVAVAIGKSRSAVANSLRLLRLHEMVQSSLRDNIISEGHAKILAGIQEHSEQLRLLKKITQDNLSVRDLEAILSDIKPAKKGQKSLAAHPALPEARKYEEEFQRVLGRRVEIQSNGKKGWIRFAFYSPWDLDMLLKRLGLIQNVDGEEEPKEA